MRRKCNIDQLEHTFGKENLHFTLGEGEHIRITELPATCSAKLNVAAVSKALQQDACLEWEKELEQ